MRHIQSDITDIKAELRALASTRFEALVKKLDERFEKIDQKFDQKFDSLKDSLASAKIWALGLYIALQPGRWLFVMAHGFKWL